MECSSMDEIHQRFTRWVRMQGARIDGVRATRTHGCGMGISADRNLKEGEIVVEVPTKALLTIESVPAAFRRRCSKLTMHGSLACFLAFGLSEHEYKDWRATWPDQHDLEETMPILWSDSCVKALPEDVRTCLLDPQRNRFLDDWTKVEEEFPRSNKEFYLYHWLIVNTRSFYFELCGQEPATNSGNMVLCPFIDYFNHQSDGCAVTFGDNGYTVTTRRSYTAGEELYTCYGSHSNDFLLIEYGFALENNRWDNTLVDSFLNNSILTVNNLSLLEDIGYLGDYSLLAAGVCHRTQVAVRLKTLSQKRWKSFVAGTAAESAEEEVDADEIITQHILLPIKEKAERSMHQIRGRLETSVSLPYKSVFGRWLQIRSLAIEAFNQSIQPKVRSTHCGQFESHTAFTGSDQDGNKF